MRARAVRAAVVVVGLAVVAGLARPGDAAFTDTVSARATLATATVASPGGLGCSALLGSATISWSPVSGATGYAIDPPSSALVTLAGTSWSTGLLSFSSGTYLVYADVGTWRSAAASITVTGTLLGCQYTVP